MQPDPRFDFQLEADLAGAGAIARSAADQFPAPAFASSLRSHLLTSFVRASAPAVAPRRRSRWAFARLSPVFAAILALMLATVVAAGVLRFLAPPETPPPAPTPFVNAALIGDDAETPTPKPTASPTPKPSPTPSPTASPTPSPSPTASPTPIPTPKPTPVPTAKPTPTPVPTPVPPPPMGELALGLTGCNGGVVIDWSAIEDPRFAKYRTLRSTSPEIPVAYPPAGGSAEVGTAKSADPNATQGYDPAAPGVTYYYRTLALDGAGAVIATSGVGASAAAPVAAMGPLRRRPRRRGDALLVGAVRAAREACFTYYKLVYSLDGSAPSYLEGDPYLAAIGDQGAATFATADLVSGQTYTFRLQAIRATHTGAFLVAQTDLATYTAP